MQFLSERLKQHQQKNLTRVRRCIDRRNSVEAIADNKHHHVFCSSDYLGLSSHPLVIKAFKKGVDQYGVGSTASQQVVGHTRAHRELEEAFAAFLNRDAALLFSSGYLANLGVISTLAGRHDTIFADKYIHASLVDATRLSGARLMRYPHQQLTVLARQLVSCENNNKLIVSDGVFSMGGDIADIKGLIELAKKNNATLMIDDAHGIGVLGEAGRGSLELFAATQAEVPALVCPMGKAFGVMGAVAAGSGVFIEALKQFARPHIYSTAPPPAIACAAMASLKVIENESWRRQKCHHLIQYFQRRAQELAIPVKPSQTPIQPILIGDIDKALSMTEYLFAQGFLLKAMRPPTVPQGETCLRVSLSCLHDEALIDELLVMIANFEG